MLIDGIIFDHNEHRGDSGVSLFVVSALVSLRSVDLTNNTAEKAVNCVHMVGLGRLELPTSTLSE